MRNGWRFLRGDAEGAEAPEFDDSAWRVVRVPHDWAIEGPFDPALEASSGRLPWRGVGWYRKAFTLDQEPGDRVYLDFDGAMAFPKIFINGKLAGEWDYGYTSFRIDATPYINLDGENVVAVRLDTRKHQTRWYPGAGLYRKVSLTIEKPVHLGHWGVFVTTPKVTDEVAEVEMKATVENHGQTIVPADISFSLVGPDGSSISEGQAAQQLKLRPGANDIQQTIRVKNPMRWDINSPNLYTLRTAVRSASSMVSLPLMMAFT
jgi:beta-galactosidase